MKRYILLFLALLTLACCACTSKSRTYLAPFKGAFETSIEGEYRGVCFSAKLSCDAVDARGVRAATLTFYAPASLSGTTLSRDRDGALSLCANGVTLEAPQGYAALLDVFDVSRAETVVREGANTRVSGEGYSLLFAEDGIPLSVTNGTVTARVLSFEQS